MSKTPKLILMRGLPGSGKSTIAQAYADTLSEADIVVIDPDTIDYSSSAFIQLSSALAIQGVDTKFHPYRYLRAQAHQGIEQGKIILWNQAFTNLDGFQKTAKNLQNHAAENGLQMPLLVVEVSATHDVVKERILQRTKNGGHTVSDEKFEQFFAEYRSFADEGYSVLELDGQVDLSLSVQAMQEKINSL